MAALQLLSHLDGDALNVALLMPESQRVVPRVLMNSLSENYSSPGRLAEYKRQFRRAFCHPDDDPSIFAIELETLARRAFADIRFSGRLDEYHLQPVIRGAVSVDGHRKLRYSRTCFRSVRLRKRTVLWSLLWSLWRDVFLVESWTMRPGGMAGGPDW